MFRSGFIAIIGRPNAGKSTLINRLVNEKVSIVTWRPQTTRNRILGIVGNADYQAIFIDTPGIHTAKNKLSEFMMKSISNSLEGVDAIVYMIDGTSHITDVDRDFIKNYSGKAPIIIALNKLDEAKREDFVETLSRLNEFKTVKTVYPISARRGDNVEELKNELIACLPEGEKLYPEDIFTDRTMRFMVGEIVREKALMFLDEEIPYGIGVMVRKFNERQDQPVAEIQADVICEKARHKGMIIGKGGSMLKKIGEAARCDIERLIGQKVFLELYVRVEEDWRNNSRALEEIGYDKQST
jgi:GTP-binding protein Era